jgi:hypothetical protein
MEHTEMEHTEMEHMEMEHTERECSETERAEVSENGERIESNGKDALNELEGEESGKSENTNAGGQVRAVDLAGEMAPPLKSVCTMKDVLFLCYFILCQVSHWIAYCRPLKHHRRSQRSPSFQAFLEVEAAKRGLVCPLV